MARHLDPADLPDDVALYAQAQVDSGRFASIADVLSAGVEASQERDRADQEWLAYARKVRRSQVRRDGSDPPAAQGVGALTSISIQLLRAAP